MEDCEDSGKCRWWRTCNNITDKYLVPPRNDYVGNGVVLTVHP